MEFITEINPAVAVAIGMFIMSLVQAIKPVIAERYIVLVVFLISTIMGLLLALSTDFTSWVDTAIQALLYTGLVASSSAGTYSLAKAVKKENPAGL